MPILINFGRLANLLRHREKGRAEGRGHPFNLMSFFLLGCGSEKPWIGSMASAVGFGPIFLKSAFHCPHLQSTSIQTKRLVIFCTSHGCAVAHPRSLITR